MLNIYLWIVKLAKCTLDLLLEVRKVKLTNTEILNLKSIVLLDANNNNASSGKI